MTLSLEDLLAIGHRRTGNLGLLGGRKFSGVSTDSRSIARGNLFIALRGGKFDGSAFVPDAFARGALCAVVDRRSRVGPFRDKPYVVVDDTVKALGDLALVHRRKFSIPIVAIAGSNGKTTTKEMTAAVLGTQYRVLRTPENLNNHIGVPQTLLRLNRSHEIAVIEIGTNHFGEIAALCRILEPTHGLMTNIGREHLEFFGTVSGVARAEGELFRFLDGSGTAFVNADDRRISSMAKRLVRTRISYGSGAECDVRSGPVSMGAGGCASFPVSSRTTGTFTVRLSVPGKASARNALAAASVGLVFGISPENVRKGLKTFTPVGKRMEVFRIAGVTIVNDTYNANPDSMIAALDTIGSMKTRGRKLAVLADMLEMGNQSRGEHRKLGRAVGSFGVQHLLTYGAQAAEISRFAAVPWKRHYEDKAVLVNDLADLAGPGDIVLVKGSRGMRMEDVVNSLSTHLEERMP